jgi:phosphoribosylaminoimidazolecarboxamide formyltransferase / IMP cyclohydrolase
MNPSKTTLSLTALLSVSDKTGLLELAHGLNALGVKLLSTGGTAKLLADAGLPVTEVADHTGFPEMLDGRVKTLHPTIHGGLLARRDVAEHTAALAAHGIPTIDLLVVNLYPFEATVAKPGCTLQEAIENIDIGGPAMVRSAAKNWKDVAVLTNADQYAGVLAELNNVAQTTGRLSADTHFSLAVAAFNRIAVYDAAISNYLSAQQAHGSQSTFSSQFNANFVKLQDLRYGENPHQSAAFYRDLHPAPGSLVTASQLQGKELSYNNIADADAAWECVKSFSDAGELSNPAACVIVKHANPCGVALGAHAAEAYSKAFKTDPTSAFGGIIAFNCALDGATATLVAQQFVEVLIATSFTAEALSVFATKPNTRLLQISLPAANQANHTNTAQNLKQDMKRVGSGLLIQTADNAALAAHQLKCVTTLQPTPAQLSDLLFAWKVAKYVKSNAIVFCAGGMTLGVGAGQMSRIDSARIASIKAENANLSLQGSAVASDAFFPFRDGLDVVVQAGATCVIQPGGSMRDDEVIQAANEHRIVMLMTGVRHFRH